MRERESEKERGRERERERKKERFPPIPILPACDDAGDNMVFHFLSSQFSYSLNDISQAEGRH